MGPGDSGALVKDAVEGKVKVHQSAQPGLRCTHTDLERDNRGHFEGISGRGGIYLASICHHDNSALWKSTIEMFIR